MDANPSSLGQTDERRYMRAKSLLLLLIALGCGIVASVAVSQVVLDQKGESSVQTADILVVAKNISAASKITPESVRIEKWPADKVPQGALVDIKQIEGKFAKQPLYVNEPLIEIKLANKGKELVIPDGYRVFDLVVNEQNGGSGYISPGDRVDVFGFFEKGMKIKTSGTVRVLENLEVLMVDGVASIDPDAPTTSRRSSSTFQLLVKDKQYAVLDTAANLGKLRVALRPPERSEEAKSKMDDGESFMAWLKESESTRPSEPIAANLPKETFEQPAAPKIDHEMIIITPEGANRFRWKEGDTMPRKVEEGADLGGEGFSTGGIQSGTPAAAGFAPPPVSGNKEVAESSNGKGADRRNLNWDPNGSSWQFGGFKAAYPPSK